MIKIKESVHKGRGRSHAPNHAIENMLRLRILGERGIDLLKEHDIKFVYGKEKADFGISKYGDKVKGVPQDKCILWKNEPPIYNVFWGRKLCNPDYLKKFMATMSCYEYSGLDQVHFITPRPVFEYVELFFNKPKPEFLCTILKNKSNAVFLNNFFPKLKKFNDFSLMSYRENCDNAFCEHMIREYHSYGRGWNQKCFKGEISTYTDKYALIAQYKLNFCPENSMFRGYVTEKPIVAMCCGSVPVYKGAPDVEEYLPKGTFIDGRNFEEVDSLCDCLNHFNDEDYKQYKENIKKFLNSDKIRIFSSVAFAEKLIDIIEGKLGWRK